MEYASGNSIKIGDKVRLGVTNEGLVVCDITNGFYSHEFPKIEWAHLETGILIYFKNFGIVHMDTIDPELNLVSRKT